MGITITIGLDGMGLCATEEDYESFVEYVRAHRASLGDDVYVLSTSRRSFGGTRIESHDGDSTEEDDAHYALQELWQAWCAGA